MNEVTELLYLGAGGLALGLLSIVTSLNPQRNFVTRVLFRINTFLPRAGSMTDKKWVLINGVAILLVGVLFIGRAVYLFYVLHLAT
jgi:hypothetical protein